MDLFHLFAGLSAAVALVAIFAAVLGREHGAPSAPEISEPPPESPG